MKKAMRVERRQREIAGRVIESLVTPNYCHKCGETMSKHLNREGTEYIGCPRDKRLLKH